MRSNFICACLGSVKKPFSDITKADTGAPHPRHLQPQIDQHLAPSVRRKRLADRALGAERSKQPRVLAAHYEMNCRCISNTLKL